MPQEGRDKLAMRLFERDAQLRGRRKTFDSLWQDVSRLTIPREATFTVRLTEGTERQRFILDSTAPRSLELFASFIHTLMNNPASTWFGVRIADDLDTGVNERPSVRRWLDAVRNIMMQSFLGAKLYSNLHQAYLALGSFGTACLFSDIENGRYRIRQFHIGDITIMENDQNEIDTVHREVLWTAKQAREHFPDKDLGPAVERVEANPHAAAPAAEGVTQQSSHPQKVRFLHCVFPTNDKAMMDFVPPQNRARLEFFPFASVWINATDQKTITIGGFEEFPYQIPRWYKTRDEVWGRSPAMTVLPDIRMANRMKETILRGAEKLVDPPLLIPDGGLISPIRLAPGGMSFSDGQIQVQPLIPPGASRIDVGDGLLKDTQGAIREGFFVPLFITPDSPVKTATQVLQEVDERNRATSPMLVRLQEELFQGMLTRNYALLARNGRLPPPPPELVGAEIEIEYISPLTGSQREQEGLSLLRLFEQLAPWAQIDEGVFDSFDPDRVAKVLSEATAVPGEVLRTPSEVRAFREQKAAQAQQQQMAENLPPTADAAAKLIKATSG